MKIFIISIFLFVSVNAQTKWYVDKDATGSNSGTSWANAFPNLTDSYLDWSAIGNGDTIYVSDGTYTEWEIRGSFNPTEINNGSRRNYSPNVVIAPSWEAGHTGDVIVSGSSYTVPVFECYTVCGLTVTGINFIFDSDATVGGGANVELGYDSLVTFDNCIITNVALGQAIAFTGDTKSNTFQNCTIQSLYNTEAGNEDLITFSGIGGHTFRNNTIARRNNYVGIAENGTNMTVTANSLTDTDLNMIPDYHINATVTVGTSLLYVTSNDATTLYGSSWSGGTPSNGQNWTVASTAHKDFIQWSDLLNQTDPTMTTTFDKNFMFTLQPEVTGWNQGIYSAGQEYTQRFLFTNNILVIDVAYAPDVFPDEPGDVHSMVVYTDDPDLNHSYWEIYNNTFITPLGGIYLDNVDSIRMKNNLIIGTLAGSNSSVVKIATTDARFDTIYKDIDYNHYYFPAWNSSTRPFSVVGGSDFTYGQWQAEGLDVNSDTGYVSVADVRDSVISAYMPSSQLQGTDLSAYGITDDILGNPRTNWTIGALEYVAGTADTTATVTFTSVSNAELNSYHIASGVLSGADSTFHIWTTTADSFKVGALSSYDIIEVTAESGDTVFISNTASNLYSTPTVSSIVVSGTTRSFTVTTKAEPIVPSGNGGVAKGSNGVIWRDSTGKVIKVQ